MLMIMIADKVICGPSLQSRERKALVTRRDRIIDIGHHDTILKRYPGHRVRHFKECVLMPGLVNVHAHLELPPLPGKAETSDYTQWVLGLIAAKKGLSPRDYLRAARENIAALIRTGTTTVGEICTHLASRDLLQQSGLRAVVFHEILSMGPQIAKERIPAASSRTASPVRDGLSPHSPHTVSEKLLLDIRDIAAQRRLPVAMHVAETRDELLLLQRRKSGLSRLYSAAGWQLDWAPRARSSVEYLDRCRMLGPRFLAVHAVHIDDRDIAMLKRSGAAVAHCPRSNRLMGVGAMPLRRVLSAGITVGIGTDSLASVPTLSMWDEMRFAQKVHERDGIRPRDIIHLATAGGAAALGLGDVTGSLEPGMKADVIVLPLPCRDTGDLHSDLLRETKSSIMTMVNGKVLYQEQV